MSILKRDMFSSVYSRAVMTHEGFFINDPKSVEISTKEHLEADNLDNWRLRHFFIAMRTRYFDEWTENMMNKHPGAVVLQLGCGYNSRCERIGNNAFMWYDIDQPRVIQERRKYYTENDKYKMLEAESYSFEWIASLKSSNECIIIMEGISKYCSYVELSFLFRTLQKSYNKLYILMDFVTDEGAKFINSSNEIKLPNDRRVSHYYCDSRDHMLAPYDGPVSGINSISEVLRNTILDFIKEHRIARRSWIKQIPFKDRVAFWYRFGRKKLRKYYRVYELETLSNFKY